MDFSQAQQLAILRATHWLKGTLEPKEITDLEQEIVKDTWHVSDIHEVVGICMDIAHDNQMDREEKEKKLVSLRKILRRYKQSPWTLCDKCHKETSYFKDDNSKAYCKDHSI